VWCDALIYVWCDALIYVWCDALIYVWCDVACWYMCDVTWHVDLCVMCVMWRVDMRAVTHSYSWCDSGGISWNCWREVRGSCRTTIWVPSSSNLRYRSESCHTYEWVMSHTNGLKRCSTLICTLNCCRTTIWVPSSSNFRYTSVCCSVLQHVAACCSMLQCIAISCTTISVPSSSNLRYRSVCCSVLQRVAARCSMLQCIAVSCKTFAGVVAWWFESHPWVFLTSSPLSVYLLFHLCIRLRSSESFEYLRNLSDVIM